MAEQVMCMDATGHPGRRWYGDAPREGKIYTVAGVGESILSFNFGEPVYYLQEISNPDGRTGIELGYSQCRFHPIRDSDIEIFREIARNPHRELEDA